jgi:hypothetical protein
MLQASSAIFLPACFPLDGGGDSGLLAAMKIKILALLGCVVVALAATGCYKKVSGGGRFGVPFAKDKVYGLYEKPVETVYTAAVQVITEKGIVNSESTVRESATNTVRTIVGRVDQRNIYIRVQPQDVNLTLIEVQARTPAGGTDLPLAHTLEKEVALRMTR